MEQAIKKAFMSYIKKKVDTKKNFWKWTTITESDLIIFLLIYSFNSMASTKGSVSSQAESSPAVLKALSQIVND